MTNQKGLERVSMRAWEIFKVGSPLCEKERRGRISGSEDESLKRDANYLRVVGDST